MKDVKFLAMDTAGHCVRAAVHNGEYFLDENGRNASATLMPAVDLLLERAGVKLEELDFIACVTGPGSFTGIRIGVSAARAFGYAAGVSVLGINYLQTLAYNERADGYAKILCVSDGSNGTAYMAEYDGDRNEISPCRCVETCVAVETANNFDGVVCADEIMCGLLPGSLPPDKDCSSLLRASRENGGKAAHWAELTPVYVRKPQAERDMEQGRDNA